MPEGSGSPTTAAGAAVKIDLLEIAVNPERIGVDDGNYILPDIRVVAKLRQQVGHPTVDRGADLSALEVDPRLALVGQRLLILRLGDNRVGTPRTGLCPLSNQSQPRLNGNWKMASRDRRPKPSP